MANVWLNCYNRNRCAEIKHFLQIQLQWKQIRWDFRECCANKELNIELCILRMYDSDGFRNVDAAIEYFGKY